MHGQMDTAIAAFCSMGLPIMAFSALHIVSGSPNLEHSFSHERQEYDALHWEARMTIHRGRALDQGENHEHMMVVAHYSLCQ